MIWFFGVRCLRPANTFLADSTAAARVFGKAFALNCFCPDGLSGDLLFGRGDILDTVYGLGTVFNPSLDYGQYLLDGADTKVKSWLEETRRTIKELIEIVFNSPFFDVHLGMDGSSSSTKALQQSTATNEETDDFKNGVGDNFMNYHFMYGGGTNATLHDKSSRQGGEGEKKAARASSGEVRFPNFFPLLSDFALESLVLTEDTGC